MERLVQGGMLFLRTQAGQIRQAAITRMSANSSQKLFLRGASAGRFVPIAPRRWKCGVISWIGADGPQPTIRMSWPWPR
jgi:hypothetical protein